MVAGFSGSLRVPRGSVASNLGQTVAKTIMETNQGLGWKVEGSNPSATSNASETSGKNVYEALSQSIL